MCCYWNDGNGNGGRGCSLEGDKARAGNVTTLNNKVELEGPTRFFVLYRVESKQVQKVRMYSPECELDGGGLPFVWLTDVKPAESLALLSTFAAKAEGDSEDDRRPANAAISAIAFHAEPQADRLLEQYASSSHSVGLRKKAIFWMGNLRGRPGYEAVKRILAQDPDDKVREHAIFALTQSKESGAIPAIIDAAKNDRSTHVRGQALFWLAQRAGRQAVAAIGDSLEHDPNTEVKKKAVFALSQLPKDEGVPKLIDVAKSNPNPEVRKQAMFWLGQSHDPRALQFFESVLK